MYQWRVRDPASELMRQTPDEPRYTWVNNTILTPLWVLLLYVLNNPRFQAVVML